MHLSEDRIVTHESDTWIPQVELPRGSWHSNYGYINLWLHYLLEWIMFVQQHNRDGAGLSNSPWIFLCDTSQPPWGWVGTKCLVLANGCKQMCSVSLHLRSLQVGEFFMLSPLASATLQRAGISKLLSGGARPWSAGQSALNFVGARNKT